MDDLETFTFVHTANKYARVQLLMISVSSTYTLYAAEPSHCGRPRHTLVTQCSQHLLYVNREGFGNLRKMLWLAYSTTSIRGATQFPQPHSGRNGFQSLRPVQKVVSYTVTTFGSGTQMSGIQRRYLIWKRDWIAITSTRFIDVFDTKFFAKFCIVKSPLKWNGPERPRELEKEKKMSCLALQRFNVYHIRDQIEIFKFISYLSSMFWFSTEVPIMV